MKVALGGPGGVAVMALYIPWPHWSLVPSAAPSPPPWAVWAAIPAYLQAKRGSHIVITNIMFNLIAARPAGLPAG
jgi:simple sugar transport system permease protein